MVNAKVRMNALALYQLLKNSSPGEFWADFDGNYEKKQDIENHKRVNNYKKRKRGK